MPKNPLPIAAPLVADEPSTPESRAAKRPKPILMSISPNRNDTTAIEGAKTYTRLTAFVYAEQNAANVAARPVDPIVALLIICNPGGEKETYLSK
jgi:hypothetical protein